MELRESENINNGLFTLSQELATCPGNQVCVVENRFSDNDNKPSEFVGMCNGFLNLYELGEIQKALLGCNQGISPIELDEPLMVLAKL